jgi:hypothetical protein
MPDPAAVHSPDSLEENSGFEEGSFSANVENTVNGRSKAVALTTRTKRLNVVPGRNEWGDRWFSEGSEPIDSSRVASGTGGPQVFRKTEMP